MKKTWTAPTLEDFNSLSHKKTKIENDAFSSNMPEPKSLTELSINSNKVEEVKQWIANNYRSHAPILLVTGPPGSGKTVTIKIVAENEGLSVIEWINPSSKIVSKDDFEMPFIDKDTFMEISEGKKFEDFLFRSSRYPSLFEPKKYSVILVKDYPNSYIRTPQFFHNFLEKYKTFGKNLIIFIITDDEKFDLHNVLFPNQLKKKLDITVIKFNSVSDTYLKKNLKSICSHYKWDLSTFSSKNLEKIIRNSAGDLRSATTDLINEMRTGILNPNMKGKKRKKRFPSEDLKITSNPLYSRDRGYGFYKKMGRILYPKRITKEPHSKVVNFVHSYLEIAEDWSTSYLGLLHENYLQTCSKIEDAVSASDCFSFCDTLSKYSEVNKYSDIIIVGGLMLSNTEPKKSGFLSFKKSFNLNNIKDFQSSFSNNSNIISCGPYQRPFALDMAPFTNLLSPNLDNHIRAFEPTNNFKSNVSPGKYLDKKINVKNQDLTSDEEEFEIENFDD